MVLKKGLALLLVMVLSASILAGCGKSSSKTAEETNTPNSTSEEPTTGAESTEATENEYKEATLSLLIDANANMAGLDAVCALAKEKLGITVEVELKPAGTDGDNIVKTRLASGEMSDLLMYNSGSLLAALNPSEYFIDLGSQPWIDRLDDTFRSTASVDGVTYGIPFASSGGGGILYSKPIYEELGLEIPKTWDEFLANCDAIKAAGKTAIVGAFADSWTAQVLYLGDHYNVAAAEPNFAADFQAGKAKYATSTAGLRSWSKLASTSQYYNEDALATTYNDACEVMATGGAAHWIMLSFALSNIYSLHPDKINDIGFFPIPGDNPEDQGITTWMPAAVYGNKNTGKTEDILRFMEFYVSDEALDTYTSAVLPDGPYCIKGYELPDNAYETVRNDMQPYYDAGKTETALEFQTAVKGPSCGAICQETVIGKINAEEAAKAYDDDCLKQAVQLGLDWK